MIMIMPWLRLARIPNVFTAVADVAMGVLFVNGSFSPFVWFAWIACSSACLYTGGMVLNDVFDIERDRRERPARPLPAGAISLRQAGLVGVGLLVAGVAAAVAAGWLAENAAPGQGRRTAGIAVCLALAIVAYDAATKQSWLGPVNMGLCRALNVLLGMSVPGSAMGPGPYAGFDLSQIAVCLGLGTYVSGITWFARDEARPRFRLPLVVGILLMLLGLSLLASFPWLAPFAEGTRQVSFAWRGIWPLTVFVLGLSIIRRCVIAAMHATPQHVQMAVKHGISSLIVLDAAVALAVCDSVVWPIAVLSLLVPFLWLGRFVYST